MEKASSQPLLLQVLQNVPRVAELSLADWDLLIRQGWHARLLAVLAERIQQAGLMEEVPLPPRQRLQSYHKLAQRHQQAIRWEARQIQQILQPLGVTPVFLKGAAYVLCDLPVSRGRLFSDVDILVPRERIDQVEQAFLQAGWVQEKTNEYDQRYFRQWMHELPPLRNEQRGMILDIHHNILPDTAANTPDARQLLANSCTIDANDEMKVFSPPDMVIHSATHLFSDGELEHGLRDLLDLAGLISHFQQQDEDFVNKLLQRGRQLGLQRPVYYGLRYVQILLKRPLLEAGGDEVAPWNKRTMDALFQRGLMPAHPSCDDRWTGLARWLLYVRSHYLRMPLNLLIPHLMRKAWRRRFGEDDKAEAN